MVHELVLKVCGITREIDAYNAVNSGANIIGVVRAQNSPRFTKSSFVENLKSSGYQVAGVYNDKNYLIHGFSGEDFIQIHYDHEPEEIQHVRNITGKRIISVISFSKARNLMFDLKGYLKEADFVLIEEKPKIIDRIAQIDVHDKKIGVAGGIKSEDIPDIIRAGFDFIDLSSSLENFPGIKNYEKL
ncbi:N-(5'-phosphoribosyl)anthranilate isomerase, partial [mine drainage metagenome]